MTSFNSSDEDAELLELLSKPHVDYIPNEFATQVCRTPESIVTVYLDEHCSYGDFSNRVSTIAATMNEVGVIGGEAVGICMRRGVHMLASIYAVHRIGCFYVPIDVDYPLQRKVDIVDDSQCAVVLSDVMAAQLSTVVVSSLKFGLQSDIQRQGVTIAPINGSTYAYVIYTSGSTGKPKGVICHHEGLLVRMQWFVRMLGLSCFSRFLHRASICFDMSVHETQSATLVGGCVILLPSESDKEVDDMLICLRSTRATVACSVPAVFAVAIETSLFADAMSEIEHFCVGGEAVPPRVQQYVVNGYKSSLVWNLYGPTEAHILVTAFNAKTSECRGQRFGIGIRLSNVKLYVVDASFNMVSLAAFGELVIAGFGLAHGYMNLPSRTAQSFVPNPYSTDRHDDRLYRSGDLCRYAETGAIQFGGRIDFQVKIRGFRIELEEISATIERLPDVQRAFVVARDMQGRKQLVAYVVSPSNLATKESVKKNLYDCLPEYMVSSTLCVHVGVPNDINRQDRSTSIANARNSEQCSGG